MKDWKLNQNLFLRVLRPSVTILIPFLVFDVCTPKSEAQVPLQFTYQGRVTDNTGVPITGITTGVVFQIVKGGDATSPIMLPAEIVHSETNDVVTDVNGVFVQVLGLGKNGNPLIELADLTTSATTSQWMSVVVDGEELLPRHKILAVPYAFAARTTIAPELVLATFSGAGLLELFGPNGNQNVLASYASGNANHGWIGVLDDQQNSKATMYVNASGQGVVTANTVSTDTLTADNCNCPSDRRLKQNIEPIGEVLDKLDSVNSIYYERIQKSPPPSANRQIGFIAQDVETVFPELVMPIDDQGYKGVDYSKMTVVLLQAVKELRAQNAELSQRIHALESTAEMRER